jgi:hypothetical protein
MKNKVAVCLMTRDEHFYLREFIDYYKALGVDDIILYDNEPKKPVDIQEEGVIVVNWPIHPVQNVTKAYCDCAIRFKDQYKWIGFFDSDEYLILKQHNNIKDFLAEYENHPAVGINWLCFGSSDIDVHVSHKDYNRHCDFEHPVNRHVKSILKPEYLTVHGPDPHVMIRGTVDTNHNPINGPFSDFKNDKAYVKHCIMRTKEDYMKKAGWGRIDIPTAKENTFRSPEKWDEHYITFNCSTKEEKIWM